MQVRNVELERHTLELENEVKDMRKKKMVNYLNFQFYLILTITIFYRN